MAKTLVIFSNFKELPKLFILDGDHRKLDGMVVNMPGNNEALEKELLVLMYETGPREKDGYLRSDTFEYKDFNEQNAPIQDIEFDYMITCGFAP